MNYSHLDLVFNGERIAKIPLVKTEHAKIPLVRTNLPKYHSRLSISGQNNTVVTCQRNFVSHTVRAL